MHVYLGSFNDHLDWRIIGTIVKLFWIEHLSFQNLFQIVKHGQVTFHFIAFFFPKIAF